MGVGCWGRVALEGMLQVGGARGRGRVLRIDVVRRELVGDPAAQVALGDTQV